MDFIKELKEKAKKIDLHLNISGSKKTKTFYRVNLQNPDKVVEGSGKKFKFLIDYYLQNTPNGVYQNNICGFRFNFNKGGYKVVINVDPNNYTYMMLFKENQLPHQ